MGISIMMSWPACSRAPRHNHDQLLTDLRRPCVRELPAAASRKAESPQPVVFSCRSFERRQSPSRLKLLVLLTRELHKQRPLNRIEPQHHLAQFRFVERSAASSV